MALSTWIVVVPLSLVALYSVMTFVLFWAFRHAVYATSRVAKSGLAPVTVIVPFRNEEQNLRVLLDSLHAQEQCELEIILVNDQSDDRSLEVIKDWQQLHLRATNIRVLESISAGKKDALTAGVAAANNAIILTTDADCQVGKYWAASMSRCFDEDALQFVFGAVKIKYESTLFSAMQQMEFASLVGSGAAMHQLGVDLFCNGANLAYRKDAFQAVNGYAGNDQIASGDDEFLMRKINTHYTHAVTFNACPESIVSTRPQPSFGQFFQQRLRWAGKWKQQAAASIATALFVFLVNASTLLLLAYLFTSSWSLVLPVLAFKIFIEFLFLYRVFKFLKIRWRSRVFALLTIVYPCYVLVCSVAANGRSFSWKHRRYRNP